MRGLIIFWIIMLALSCKRVETNNKVVNTSSQVKNDSFLLSKETLKTDTLEQDFYILDTLSLKSVKFNNKRMFFLLTDFNLKKVDSIDYDLWECGHPLEWMDKKHPVDSLRSIYVEGARYITNENSALLIASRIKNNELSIFKNEKLNEFTSIQKFKKIFPLSYKNFIKAKKLNPENYIEYDYLDVGFTKEQPEDHWIFYFNKEGFLVRFELHWWLC